MSVATINDRQDPMIRMRQTGTKVDVWCRGCGKQMSALEAQWGKDCRACRPKSERANLNAVALEDIDDIYAYVETYVRRRFADVPDQEEYVSEGIAITYRLHRESWKRELQPSFSKYLSTLLWQRLKDWHRVQRRQKCEGTRDTDGEQRFAPVVSLDAMREANLEVGQEDGRLAA
jgi:DNA-directed RNA polymerase specialized sigma24 family protein